MSVITVDEEVIETHSIPHMKCDGCGVLEKKNPLGVKRTAQGNFIPSTWAVFSRPLTSPETSNAQAMPGSKGPPSEKEYDLCPNCLGLVTWPGKAP